MRNSRLNSIDGYVAQWQIVADLNGVIVGKVWFPARASLDEIKAVREFLCEISKRKGETMAEQKTESKTNGHTNMCYIEGEIKTLKVREDSAFLLVDTECDDGKHVPCTVWQDRELLKVINLFREGDSIRLLGWARSWSQKKDGEWRNQMDIRITQIKTKPPARREQPKPPRREPGDEDGVPF